MLRNLQVIIILVFCQTSLSAQVKLLLDYNARTDEYTVSMMPERTWRSPYNKTATGQITLKATTGQFFVKDIISHLPESRWVPSGRVDQPEESPNYDYIFFRLKTPGLVEWPYRAFRPTKLFTIKITTNCAREVMLVDNREDPFIPPNSLGINIGNSIGVLGANGEAYIGNLSHSPIFCPYAIPPAAAQDGSEDQSTAKVAVKAELSKTMIKTKLLYPNPTVNEVNITLDWTGAKGEKKIMVYNDAGQMVRSFDYEIFRGGNKITLNISALDNGVYNLFLVDKDSELRLGEVIKMK